MGSKDDCFARKGTVCPACQFWIRENVNEQGWQDVRYEELYMPILREESLAGVASCSERRG